MDTESGLIEGSSPTQSLEAGVTIESYPVSQQQALAPGAPHVPTCWDEGWTPVKREIVLPEDKPEGLLCEQDKTLGSPWSLLAL